MGKEKDLVIQAMGAMGQFSALALASIDILSTDQASKMIIDLLSNMDMKSIKDSPFEPVIKQTARVLLQGCVDFFDGAKTEFQNDEELD